MQKEVTIKILYWWLIPMVLLAYSAWEIYWYRQVGFKFIKWHTHLAVPVYIFLLVAGIIYFATKTIAPKYTTPLIVSFAAIMCSVLLTEIVFIVTGYNKTYFEKNNNTYTSLYTCPHSGRYHIWHVNPHYIDKKEYTYPRPTNIEGLPDSNWITEKITGVKKIMTIGDSFTEGDGAPYDSTYPAFLKQHFTYNNHPVYIMNAGVCGSDPFYSFVLFKEKLLKYRPEIAIQMLSTTDVLNDYMTRGGMERFNGDTVTFRKAPAWELLYAISYTGRLFFTAAGYTEFLIKEKKDTNNLIEADTAFIQLFKKYADLCRDNNVKLVLVLRPDFYETLKGRYNYNFSNMLGAVKLNTDITIIDLLPLYKQYIAHNHTQPQMYYWPVDGHHNATGYKMLADVVYPEVNQLLADSIR